MGCCSSKHPEGGVVVECEQFDGGGGGGGGARAGAEVAGWAERPASEIVLAVEDEDVGPPPRGRTMSITSVVDKKPVVIELTVDELTEVDKAGG